MTDGLHECKAFPQEDSDEVIIECALCGWGTTATEEKYVEDLIDTHYMSQLEWPYPNITPKNWPGIIR